MIDSYHAAIGRRFAYRVKIKPFQISIGLLCSVRVAYSLNTLPVELTLTTFIY